MFQMGGSDWLWLAAASPVEGREPVKGLQSLDRIANGFYSDGGSLMGGRLMVRLRTLDPPIGVRLPASQFFFVNVIRQAAKKTLGDHIFKMDIERF